MPIYMRIEGVDGDVQAAGAIGGVWKTTNFLTSDPARVMQVSRISLAGGIGGVDGRDAAPMAKAAQLFQAARTSGKIYIATDAGVYRSAYNHSGLTAGAARVRSSTFDQKGRLLIGSEQGIWGSGGVRQAANKMLNCNNLRQIGLAVHNVPAVDILVTDAGGSNATVYRLHRASVTGSSGTFTLTFNGQTTY